MEIVMRKLSELRPWENNPRVNKDAVEAVARSIQTYGVNQPIVLDQHDRICVGHTRYLAALQLGMEEYPTYKKEMTEQEFQGYNLADNKTHEKSFWDDEKLKGILTELRNAEFDLKLTGFEDKEILTLIGYDPNDISKALDNVEKEGGDGYVPPATSHVKMVQLFFNPEQHEEFFAIIDKLTKEYSTESLTDTLMEALRELYSAKS